MTGKARNRRERELAHGRTSWQRLRERGVCRTPVPRRTAMREKAGTGTARRKGLTIAAQGMGATPVLGFPSIVPASVFGATAPSKRINGGAIGTGRISRGPDLPGVWKYDPPRLMAVCH